jgi:hypothetical protein
MRLPVNARSRNGSGPSANRKQRQDLDQDRRVCLRGDLEQIGLPTLLTVLDMERVSGVVEIWRNDQLGTLWLRAGRVLRATVEGAARLTGKIAACDMIAWAEGCFEVMRADVDIADEIGTATTHLLMEAARRVDEAGAVLLF